MFHRRLHGPCPLLWRVVARGPEVEPSICDLAHNGAALAYLPDYTDRKEFWTLDGNLVRWVGVALLDVDGALRIWPVFVLGRRFSGLVAFSRGIRLLVPPLLARIHSLLREHFGRRSYQGLLAAAQHPNQEQEHDKSCEHDCPCRPSIGSAHADVVGHNVANLPTEPINGVRHQAASVG